ncbi:MAG: cupredoxin domain-containing protein [Armatimonadota bacterium]|nr:cupredoxin domain-containing protein [Armatimonadota bacterium]MDR7443127.1 cupredoxin domain-containing protein [Armatimonadota bacterium]MDR7569602.1 cupredoxin domain-containing protein [Armatimonadota bacterium]MDR7614656.1 cupredoxin domain-containing protein [Armatimonadota bacterium]
MRKAAVLGAVGLVLVLAIGGLGGTAPQPIKVVAKEFSFEPKEIKVKAGQPVKLLLENKGVIEHDIVIEKLNAKTQPLKPGKSAEVSFTPKAKGRYLIYCSVPGHKEAGMTGTLVVE